jgi:3-hydroxyisobutyrate dehydrogenase
MTTVGVLGLGRMGGGVAAQLCRSGFTVRAFDISGDAVQAACAHGAEAALSAPDCAAGSDAVVTSLPQPEDVLGMYQRDGSGILPGAAGRVFIDISTVDPATSCEVERRVKEAGGLFVACPLGKGPQQAAAGESPLFVGGETAAVSAAREVLDAIGGPRHMLGSVSAATAFKLVSNMIAFANLSALCEGYLVAKAAGITDDAFTAALGDTGGMSYQASLRLPWVIEHDLAPRFAVDLARKDLRLGVDLAARQGNPVPLTAAALQELIRASSSGFGALDAAAIVRVLAPGDDGNQR